MMEVPAMNDIDVVFGNIKHLPPYDSIPDRFKRYNDPYVMAVSSWFFCGAKVTDGVLTIDDVKFIQKPGVDMRGALKAIKAVLSSFEPKHEHKEAGCAYMLSEWFEPVEDQKRCG